MTTWITVPAEATEEMCGAIFDGTTTLLSPAERLHNTASNADVADCWRAMIAAAPKPDREARRERIARELAWQLGDTMGDARQVYLSSEMHTNGARWLKAADAIMNLEDE